MREFLIGAVVVILGSIMLFLYANSNGCKGEYFDGLGCVTDIQNLPAKLK